MQRLFLSPGSKHSIARQLVALYPAHTVYVEPFAGGAACFWEKKPSPTEVLNDYDPDVVGAYTFVRDATPAQLSVLAGCNWRVEEATFSECQQPHPDPLVNTYRFIYRRRASFGARETVLARNKVGKLLPVARYLGEQQKRLRGVTITQGDGFQVIRKLDRPGVFCFLDPPWPGYFKKWGHFTMPEMHRLIDTLKRVQHARWLWAESPEIMGVIGEIPQGWRCQEINHVSTGYGGRRKLRTEVVFTNYG
jgi:DNA adenine methylase